MLAPGLDALEVEDGEADGGAGPSGIVRANSLEADEAGQGAGGGGDEEGLDLGEIEIRI